jgi:hypothetical protein
LLLLLLLLVLLVLLLGFSCRQGIVQCDVHTSVAVAVHMDSTRDLHTTVAKARVNVTELALKAAHMEMQHCCMAQEE